MDFGYAFDTVRVKSTWATVTLNLGGPVTTTTFPDIKIESMVPVIPTVELILGGRVIATK